MAEMRSKKTAANVSRDKAYTDAVDVLKSRGISKKILRELYEMSNRKVEDIKDEFSAKLWAMRAAGMPIAKQLSMFAEPSDTNDEALRKAYIKGRDSYTDGTDSKDNPFQPSSAPGQEWIRGWQAVQNENILSMKAH